MHVVAIRHGGRDGLSAGALALLLGALTLACGTSTGSAQTAGSAQTSGSNQPPGATGAPPAVVDCAIVQPPGPADEPPRQGTEIDTSNDGPGRWRLCLTTPIAVAVEGTAWCRWDAARTTVDEVAGQPTSVDQVEYDAWLSFPGSAFEVHLTDHAHGGVIANYGPRAGLPVVATGAGRVEGTAPVDVVLVADAGEVPVGAPPALAGGLVWACGEPPPPA